MFDLQIANAFGFAWLGNSVSAMPAIFFPMMSKKKMNEYYWWSRKSKYISQKRENWNEIHWKYRRLYFDEQKKHQGVFVSLCVRNHVVGLLYSRIEPFRMTSTMNGNSFRKRLPFFPHLLAYFSLIFSWLFFRSSVRLFCFVSYFYHVLDDANSIHACAHFPSHC